MSINSGETIRIQLTDEMLLLLMRGGTVNYIQDQVQIRIEQKTPLVIIDRDDYRDLKRHIYNPAILEHIFGKIDK
ncbi:hypothetical protein SDA16_06935 [Legionella pneumophila serogroup 1]|uniref:Uncharacterized protein n=1 Tax=Legionella pneumophila TaxID=446 RepID=A0A140AYM5_LEGPN|nr:hypothetical protein [Legionella pneumophila]HCC3235839.1 hypothetical protein [Legionella pneumophila subsp. pneumophila]ALK43922.1 hypothetical protein [Legionella pneumophila]HAT2149821.1 hypothetical protein [Legionella pneumophila]HAT8621023.1 hypothetical protein [Legionella pneumophila]HAT8730853.1 hypothetical protein [Legionella pneumophila]